MTKVPFLFDNLLTNEEKRVFAYSGSENPTNPCYVTPDTPLESMNLNWRERDLPEKERTKHVHRLHPYLGKFIPQLVEIFLRKYFKQRQTVLDPFCGSGTTLVQANELGINSFGYDISAFNALLASSKVRKYDINKARRELMDILNKLAKTTQNDIQMPLYELSHTIQISETDNEYLKKWFAPQSLNELLTYRELIERGDYEYKNLMRVILSRSARSARLTTHFDLDFPKQPQKEPYWCYKHSRECYPTQEAFKFINRYSLDTIRRIKEFSMVRTEAVTEVFHENSKKADFPIIDGVITSPPYVGLIDYHEQHAYAYHLLGLEDKRENEIGPASNGSSHKAQQKYQEELAEVFMRVKTAMRNGGRIIVVAADTKNLYGEIAKMVDVEVEAVVNRHVNRRTGRRANEFYESIFIWKVS